MDAFLIVCPLCGKRIPKPTQFPLICTCGTHIGPNSETIEIKTPLWVHFVQRMSKPEDIGLGATVKRIAAKFGGERFKQWSEKIGLPCGCTDREVEWNRLYPNPKWKG